MTVSKNVILLFFSLLCCVPMICIACMGNDPNDEYLATGYSGGKNFNKKKCRQDRVVLPVEIVVKDDSFPVELKKSTEETLSSRMQDLSPAISAFAALISAFVGTVALCSIKHAKESVQATKISTESQILFNQMQEYKSKEMLDALNELNIWIRSSQTAENWKEKLSEGNSFEYKVNDARRRLKFFLLTTMRFYEIGIISEDIIKEICDTAVIDCFNKAIMPMEEELDSSSDKMESRTLKARFDDMFRKCNIS